MSNTAMRKSRRYHHRCLARMKRLIHITTQTNTITTDADSPAIGLLATFARSEEDNPPPQTLPNPSVHDGGNTARRPDQEIPLDTATETSLFDETKSTAATPSSASTTSATQQAGREKHGHPTSLT
ncbi:hypothetical protein CPAR01_02046 [Colletotrichum paranaense]|uniref:Uncharacterized protein n=1 Tax=Colletotrichum paranaense TaxID=1914294 RepID=A0ABQ9SYH9_9PEZI|nr:uncharacterized protein CPAR01_02046 [Colletotrichum paranaense]KAK1544544.1 hypothetical protein CPAR01_02046 [Colletotrichum paranaense]